MPKRSGIIFVTMGVVLLLSALLLFLYNGYEDSHAGQEAELLLTDIQASISEKAADAAASTEMTGVTELQQEQSGEMPVEMMDGYGYIGYLSIPELELQLPVMAEWDYSRLKIAPCRQYGSTGTNDLVIAAHNYESHFGELSDLKTGAEIVFTDMEGVEYRYMIMKEPVTLAPDAVDEVLNSEYDLVLYTCTPGGAARVAVFCNRIFF